MPIQPSGASGRISRFLCTLLRLAEAGWMDVASVHRVGNSGPGNRGSVHCRKYLPRQRSARLGEIADASEGMFEIVSVRNDRADYEPTNHEFRDRLRKNWDAAISLVGEETVRRFDKYFRVSAAGFSRGTTNLFRITFRRLAHPRFNIAL